MVYESYVEHHLPPNFTSGISLSSHMESISDFLEWSCSIKRLARTSEFWLSGPACAPPGRWLLHCRVWGTVREGLPDLHPVCWMRRRPPCPQAQRKIWWLLWLPFWSVKIWSALLSAK